jgi:hypothetical protein
LAAYLDRRGDILYFRRFHAFHIMLVLALASVWLGHLAARVLIIKIKLVDVAVISIGSWLRRSSREWAPSLVANSFPESGIR